ncbi:hypothetical protein [Mitsuokella sp. WILCCON 0060]|uniref:hypothetical protein n=1 Tax=Mitsuokella sp. WILCCON 0060 TaxID=3345341 RepID=UPI003F1E2853
MKSLKNFKKEQMKDPEFAKAYRDIEPEMNFIRALVDARTGQNLTELPNKETLQAMQDVLHGKNLSRTYDSADEVMRDLND